MDLASIIDFIGKFWFSEFQTVIDGNIIRLSGKQNIETLQRLECFFLNINVPLDLGEWNIELSMKYRDILEMRAICISSYRSIEIEDAFQFSIPEMIYNVSQYLNLEEYDIVGSITDDWNFQLIFSKHFLIDAEIINQIEEIRKLSERDF